MTMVIKMLDSKKSDGSCSFSEEVVSYLYNEMKADEKKTFEDHLKVCEACPNELSTLTAVSESIQGWRDYEFADFSVPEITIPYRRAAGSSDQTDPGGVSASWIGNLRRMFDLSSSFLKPAAALGGLAIIIGIGWILINGLNGGDDKAIEKAADRPNKVVIKTDVEQPLTDDTELVGNENPEPFDPGKDQPETAETAVVKNGPSDLQRAQKVRRPRVSKRIVVKKTPIKQPSVAEPLNFEEIPTLTVAIQDSEYDELRLSDLFSEIGNDKE